jgi:hypothetical protein
MGYFNSFGFEFYVKKGTTDSVTPVSPSGLTQILNLSDSPIQSTSQTTEVLTYDAASIGWAQAIVTQNSYTIPCTLNIDVKDPGYILLKEAARDAAAGIALQWLRRTPLAAQNGVGAVQYLTIIDPSVGGTVGLKNNVATSTSGSGTGLLVDLNIAAGGSASTMVPEVTAAGSGYAIGDEVSVSAVLATTSGPVKAIVQAISGVGTKEQHSGIAFVGNFSESIQAGQIATCTFTLNGFGPYLYLKAL